MLPLKDSQLGNKSGNLLREKIRTLPLGGRGGNGWPGWYVFPRGVGWDGPRVVRVSEVPRSGVAGLGGGGVYPGLAGVTLWAALARMPSPARVCCRPRSSRSTPCLSPGWPYPMSPVSRGLGSRWPGLPPGLGTLKDDGDIPSPFQDLVLQGDGRTPSVPGAVSVVLSAVAGT